MKKLIALLLAIVCILSLAACNPGETGTSAQPGGTNTDPNAGGSVSATGVAPGTHGEDWRDYTLAEEQVLDIVLNWGSTGTIDPNDATGSVQWSLLQAVGEGLYRVYGNPDGTQQLEYAGAESHTVSDDGLTYTFKIRENYWSDGKKVTAQDYAFSIRRLLDPAEAFGYASYMFVLKNAASYYNGGCTVDDLGIATPDESTLVLTLEKPISYFTEMLGMVPLYPIREDVINAAPDKETWQTEFEYQVFNGPFVISEHIKDNRLVLTPNPNYWDKENIKLTQINLLTITETATLALMFENGELDVVEGSAEFIERWGAAAQNGTYTKLQLGRPQTAVISFNQYARDDMPDRKLGGSSGLMLNDKCRLAISLALDREGIISTVFNRYTVAEGWIPKGMKCGDTVFRDAVQDNYLTELKKTYDTNEKIRALFEEGMAEEGMTGGVESVTLKHLTTASTSLVRTQIEYYQQNIQEVLGCTVELEIVDSTMYNSVRDSGEWDYMNYSWIGDYDDPSTFTMLYTSDSGYYNGFGGFNNADYDALIAQTEAETDHAKRLDLFAQAEKILIEKAGVAPVYYGDIIYFYHPNVHNWNCPQFNPAEFTRVFFSAE